ncbi:MAG: hypothetical protein U0168_24950 [Nannocystaceae bacterium]
MGWISLKPGSGSAASVFGVGDGVADLAVADLLHVAHQEADLACGELGQLDDLEARTRRPR